MKLPSLAKPPKMVSVVCLKEVNGVKLAGPVEFEFDGQIQKWPPGEERSIPVYAYKALKGRRYECFQLKQGETLEDPEEDSELSELEELEERRLELLHKEREIAEREKAVAKELAELKKAQAEQQAKSGAAAASK
jgi:hypothetical protein